MIVPVTERDIPALADMVQAFHAPYASRLSVCCHAGERTQDIADALDSAMASGAQVLFYRTEGVPRGYLGNPPVFTGARS